MTNGSKLNKATKVEERAKIRPEKSFAIAPAADANAEAQIRIIYNLPEDTCGGAHGLLCYSDLLFSGMHPATL